MAIWENQAFNNVGDVSLAESQRAFMTRVYTWMFVGLGLTAAVAFFTASTPAIFIPAMRGFWFLAILEVGLVFALSFLATKLSPLVAGLMFLAYSALNGLTLSSIFIAYQFGSIANAFVLTSALFGAMSLYGTLTKRDLTSWSSFLFIGLIGVVVAGVVNIFIMNDVLGFVISCATVVVFLGLTAYDTQKLRGFHMSMAVRGGASIGSVAIVGALTLYLDFINLFLALLRLFGRRR